MERNLKGGGGEERRLEARGLVRLPYRQAHCVERPLTCLTCKVPGSSPRTARGQLAVPSALILEGEELALLLALDPRAF